MLNAYESAGLRRSVLAPQKDLFGKSKIAAEGLRIRGEKATPDIKIQLVVENIECMLGSIRGIIKEWSVCHRGLLQGTLNRCLERTVLGQTGTRNQEGEKEHA